MALVVTSKVKAHIKKAKMNTAGNLIPALDKEINHLDAMKRDLYDEAAKPDAPEAPDN